MRRIIHWFNSIRFRPEVRKGSRGYWYGYVKLRENGEENIREVCRSLSYANAKQKLDDLLSNIIIRKVDFR